MSVQAIYRISIWLPVVVPIVVIALAKALHLQLAAGLLWEVLAYSLLYGGIPYALLAMWGTWWVGGRPEADIRRMMLRAPWLMIPLFAAFWLLVGMTSGRELKPFVGVAVVGAVIIIPLGYAYVGLAMFLRRWFGPQAA